MQLHKFKVLKDLAGSRLDIAAGSLCDLSRSRLQQLIKSGDVLLNNEPPKDPKRKVLAGDEITIAIPSPIDTTMRPCDIALNIIYEDEHLLVINKQAGLTVHPGAGQHSDTLANALLKHCGSSLSGIGGVSRPGIVHRLDRDTSGLMVVAKNDPAHISLAEQIAERQLKRVYKAIVWGSITPPSGIISANLDRSRRDRTMVQVVKSGGKIATTHYKTLEIYPSISLVECKLETGRTHQIRVHMSHIGYSIFGDPIYGNHKRKLKHLLSTFLDYKKSQEYPAEVSEPSFRERLASFSRQALHSCYIEFTHPATGKIMSFASELPEDIAQIREIFSSLINKADGFKH